jgi:hypothetical protein
VQPWRGRSPPSVSSRLRSGEAIPTLTPQGRAGSGSRPWHARCVGNRVTGRSIKSLSNRGNQPGMTDIMRIMMLLMMVMLAGNPSGARGR